jgi:hypothetical protein
VKRVTARTGLSAHTGGTIKHASIYRHVSDGRYPGQGSQPSASQRVKAAIFQLLTAAEAYWWPVQGHCHNGWRLTAIRPRPHGILWSGLGHLCLVLFQMRRAPASSINCKKSCLVASLFVHDCIFSDLMCWIIAMACLHDMALSRSDDGGSSASSRPAPRMHRLGGSFG